MTGAAFEGELFTGAVRFQGLLMVFHRSDSMYGSHELRCDLSTVVACIAWVEVMIGAPMRQPRDSIFGVYDLETLRNLYALHIPPPLANEDYFLDRVVRVHIQNYICFATV